jgi:hypothetical protein
MPNAPRWSVLAWKNGAKSAQAQTYKREETSLEL